MERIRFVIEEKIGESIAVIKQYAGELNLNYKCELKNGDAYNVKFFHPDTSPSFVNFLYKLHLHCNDINYIKVPQIIPWKNGEYITEIQHENTVYKTIILSWVEGKLLSNIDYHPTNLIYSIGELTANLQQSLSSFQHEILHQVSDWDTLQLESHESKIKHLRSSEEKDIINIVFKDFSDRKDIFKDLPFSNCHNDLHTENILISFNGYEAEMCGLIDFGDVMHTARISDIAISCAYIMMDKKDPLAAAGNYLRGFTSKNSLEENEISVLSTLIKARLAISVLISAKKRANDVTDPYQFISEKKAWKVLRKLNDYPRDYITYYFRAHSGFPAHPNQELFSNWCEVNQYTFHNIIEINESKIKNVDLSVGSKVIPATHELYDVKAFQKRIDSYIEDNEIDAAYGGYGEIRPFYTTDNYETENDKGYQWRTQHLGLDVWTSLQNKKGERRKIYSPYGGEIICSHNNDIDCDYGATLMIKHQTESFEFYTLYGHLSLDSLDISPLNRKVKAGDHIAYLGDTNENGNWAPHLHFQVLLDLLENETNYPGVAYAHEWKIWKSICPDPSLLFPLFQTKDNESINSHELKLKRKQILGKNLSITYNKPLTILRGYMQYLYDINGRRYLDTINNVAHVGHEHPEISKVAIPQIQLLNTNTRYLHPEIIEYAENLLATFPDHLNRVYFTNSGSESNELALRIAASKTKNRNRLVLKMGYHGNTAETVDVSSYKFDREGGEGIQAHVSMINYYEPESAQSKEEYITKLQEILNEKGAMSFIGENILSCAGQVVLDSEMMQEIYRRVKDNGGVCIADEVQTGFGRVGDHFWAFELHGLEPDVVTMGKPIANGHPVGAVVCSEELAESFDNGMEYFNTYGGNAVSMSISNAVLRIVKEEKMQAHASEMELVFYRCVEKLELPASVRVKTRGKGLFLGIEMLESGKSATGLVSFVKNRMRERGFLMSSDGRYENVLKIKPPMVFNEKDMLKLFNNIQRVLKEYEKLKA